ncbi:MAG: hypothetical protein CSB13_01115 [Chloroflexi bacterium]|nr:MAG: hypothetical protein CSB13_01115 [Chloroflexota bacterium]
MNINNLLLLSALVNRALDAARAVKQGIHTVIHWIEEATLTQLLDLPHFAVAGCSIETTSSQDITLFSEKPNSFH